MSEKNNGGPAFPIGSTPEEWGNGMTLRDYFAGKVLPAIYADCMAEIEKYGIHRQSEWLDNVAKDAYQIADAMLKARQE